MTVPEILAWLERRGTKRNRDGMARYAIVAPKAFGVTVGDLRNLGKKLGRDQTLAGAQQRLADTVDAIARGDFPPTPEDVFLCETCAFASVCRKDYVGDV